MKKLIVLLLAAVLHNAANCLAQDLTADSARIDKLPALPFLPEPLVLDEGGRNVPVTSPQQWEQRKAEIKKQYQYWVSGAVPPAPGKITAKVLSETMSGSVKLRLVELSFGPGNRAKMTLELMIPPATKPLPVFMTQWNHRGWAQIAVRRGYIACVYAGADNKDDTKNYNEIFAGYDFATLMKRAWGASRVVDYLYGLPEVDTARIALTGHSRNGKQSLMAAAFDERIKAVVTSSGGTGGESTFRYSDERFGSESVEEITRVFPHWFHPRLHLFAGREQHLPADQNLLMSLIAPRGLMMVSAITEGQGNAWGIEQSYKSVKKAYHFLNADSNVAILLRRGRHQHAARDAEDFIDFFDYVFQRSQARPANRLYYGYSFEQWQQLSKETAPPSNLQSAGLQQRIQWLLGDEPPGIFAEKPLSALLSRNSTYPDDYLAEVIGQPNLPKGVKKMEIGAYTALGDDLWGTVYFPADKAPNDTVSGKLPLVIFLHGYSYATGSQRRTEGIIRRFTAQGYAVLLFDLPGMGTRAEEAARFYNRYPHWSLMGKMVADTRSILNDACTRMPFVDTTHIYLAGYSLGGTVALLTAALDSRVKGTAVAAAFGSLRHDNAGTEGIRHYARLHGLMPRLGFFEGREGSIPVDFDEVLSNIAPRPQLVISPAKDRHHTLEKVRQLMRPVKTAYQQKGAEGQLEFSTPDDYNRFTVQMQDQMAEWLGKQR
ncbi:alpha/beta fold hydrolase [Chitinophaga agrisoli]|uniref:Alpha/beta fold hydrolase n=1 Tax=Chitinophaga agrisoli TaxID=2607653 RepID=A0A5B2VWV0_9BACT|nr:alpha/beta fold hydrolase [Chitinophaga agrisoli]KAA2242676.1 alpha/beta fold hydrolase [Chitinophaga agrisoli]